MPNLSPTPETEARATKGYGFARLDQLVVEHLVGAR